MRTVTIDSVVWQVEPTGPVHAVDTGQVPTDVESAGVRFSRHGEARTRVGYISADVPLEEVPDMVLSVAFDEGFWEGEPPKEA
jgi:hypothetical protein